MILVESLWTIRSAKRQIQEDARNELIAEMQGQHAHVLIPVPNYHMESIQSLSGNDVCLPSAAPAYTRSKAVGLGSESVYELPAPTRARRASRQTKTSLSAAAAAVKAAQEMHPDTDTAENSSVTPESESSTEDDTKQEVEDEQFPTPQLKEDSENDSESENEVEQEVEELGSSSSSASDSDSEDDKDSDEEEDEEEEDLSQLLVKAQESLKRKAMFVEAESENEPRFNFPKLQNKLDTDNVYIQQDGFRAKVNLSTVVVVDNNGKNKIPGGIIAERKAKSGGALETCEVNMNAEKVHVSKKQKQEVEFEDFATHCIVLYSVFEVLSSLQN
ncbi:hypothetical protein BG004_007017 [Podila humilis]|nr:hypothetical protein BG004_007017 [Podila humilis]